MFHDSENFVEIFWHDGQKSPFGAIWAQFGPKLHNLY